ncbi:chemotaxis protein CheB [Mesorhizobium sp. PAMC28654]|uniref:chemotaxis protein CheB n=1 Tax=Mesorhizobium sp. PAMC28654 TaxID=2880934 RepID=UPI001D0BCA2F|nr:chemotaxis protein CheB [Mesorhizobium sp. PAMC28654]UDL89335.1 chemotaxis protein CheB [Mesorhizobium sp. PAMC28654]
MARTSIVVIGASAGGVSALRLLAGALPADFPAAILVVQHIGAHKSELPALLTAAGSMPAKHAEDGETIVPGHIYLAPPDRHLTVNDGRLHLSRGPKENCSRPAIDPLFRSVAANYGAKAAGVILTGNLNDGTLGLLEIKLRGGVAIVQDPEDAAHPDMPRSAAAHVRPDYCLPLTAIPKLLVELVNGSDRKAAAMPISPSQQNAGAEPEKINGNRFERPLTVTCPECGGALKRRVVGSIVKFDCHIGHTYTAEVMAAAQFEEMEKVMRAAVRFLNERAEFCLQMAEHIRTAEPVAAAEWHAASKQAMDRAYKLRDLVEQDWITPESSGIAPVGNGRDRAVSDNAIEN